MHPLGIVFYDDKVYITDREWSNHCISVFQLDCWLSDIIGPGCLKNPWYILVSSNIHLLVANKGYHCMHLHIYAGWCSCG